MQGKVLFENPFHIEDLAVFDDDTLHTILAGGCGVPIEQLAHSLQNSPQFLVDRVEQQLSLQQHARFTHALRLPLSQGERDYARRHVLDSLFWELTYWKTPELYEELTEGERLHPGIFQHLDADVRGKVVADVGAGCGRASFECMRHGAACVYAIDPSPGLLHILQRKQAHKSGAQHIITLKGRFDALPLADSSVDVALSCSAFTTTPEQGGDPGLTEMKRVTKAGGKIVLIWPSPQDHEWLMRQGFHYVTLPTEQEMCVHFRSLQSALHCAHYFYAHNEAVAQYILTKEQPEVPFSVIGINPPCDYCWLDV